MPFDPTQRLKNLIDADKDDLVDAIDTGVIDTAQMVDGAVSSLKIAQNAVTNNKIADGAVDSAQVVASAITNGKIASGAVTESELEGTRNSGEFVKYDGSSLVGASAGGISGETGNERMEYGQVAINYDGTVSYDTAFNSLGAVTVTVSTPDITDQYSESLNYWTDNVSTSSFYIWMSTEDNTGDLYSSGSNTTIHYTAIGE